MIAPQTMNDIQTNIIMISIWTKNNNGADSSKPAMILARILPIMSVLPKKIKGTLPEGRVLRSQMDSACIRSCHCSTRHNPTVSPARATDYFPYGGRHGYLSVLLYSEVSRTCVPLKAHVRCPFHARGQRLPVIVSWKLQLRFRTTSFALVA